MDEIYFFDDIISNLDSSSLVEFTYLLNFVDNVLVSTFTIVSPSFASNVLM